MRLGGPVYGDTSTPEAWVAAVRAHGYRAAYCPLQHTADAETVRAYAQAAAEADLVIAEVGAWSNPLSPDDAMRADAVELNQRRLAVADEVGARCCVNLAGTLARTWDGPHPENLGDATFALIKFPSPLAAGPGGPAVGP